MTPKKLWYTILPHLLDPWRESWLDLKQLSPVERFLAILGYAIFGSLVICTLLLELFGSTSGGVQYTAEGITRHISWVAIFVCSLGFAAGWGYLIVGTAHIRWYLAVIPLLLLGLQGLIWGSPVSAGLVLVGLAGLAVGMWWAHTQNWLTTAGHWVTLAVTGVILLATLLFWFSDTPQVRGLDAYIIFALAFWPTEPVWILAGLALVQFSLNITSSVVYPLRLSISENSLRWLVLTILWGHIPLNGLLWTLMLPFTITQSESNWLTYMGLISYLLLYDAAVSLVLGAIALIPLLLGRWNGRTAALFLALRLTLLVYVVSLFILNNSGFDVSDVVYGTVGTLNLLPPAFYFMVMLVITILTFFVPFMQGDSPQFPQVARLSLAWGVAITATTVIFFYLQSRDVQTGADISSGIIIPITYYLGATVFGWPYLLYTAVRNPQQLIGDLTPEMAESNISEPAAPSFLGRMVIPVAMFFLPLLLLSLGCFSLTILAILT